MRILLIDDSAAYREEFANLLDHAHVKHSVLDFATTVTEGARMMAADTHDMYIVDYRLPGGDGLDLVRDARKAGIIKPIIVLTGYTSPLVDHAAEEAGASDYLPKGEFSPQMLNRAIRYSMRAAESVRLANESANLFKLAQAAGRIGAWEWQIASNTYTWSDQMRDMYRVPAGETVTYSHWSSRLHPEDRDATQAALAAALGGEATFDTTHRVLLPNSARPHAPPITRWYTIKGELTRDANGAPVRMVGVSLDVTAQQEALAILQSRHHAVKDDLQFSQARFQTYFEASTECLFHVRADPDGHFRYEAINPAGLKCADATLAAILDRTPEEVLGLQSGQQMTDALRTVCETGAPYYYQPTFSLPSGPTIFDAVYMPLRDGRGVITGVLGSARDITDRRRLESQLVQSQKMEALGQLAGGVAHDFNNLLTGMLGCFEMLGRSVKTDRERRIVEQGCRAVERSTALTARLLAFSRNQPMTTQPVDINDSLEEITEMLSRTLGSDVRIGKNLAPDLWLASTDRNQVELAILNLGINARDAMPLGGNLTITTRNETLAQAQGDLLPGEYVAIDVADTGSGMTPEILAHALEPFFTTKGPGKGTGLGLSMVAGVTQQLGGGLSIASEVGKGTCVTLYLPRAQAVAVDQAADPNFVLFNKAVPAAIIMLVDDDPDTLAAVTGYVTDSGHQIVHARTGAQALALLDAGHPVDVMVIDATFPGVSYQHIIAQALARRPGLAVMAISGNTVRSESGDVPMLAKPFRQDIFNNALATLLTQNRTAENVVPIRGVASAG